MEQGLLSRSGWAVVDESARHVLTPDGSVWKEWVEARPAGDRQDLYLFAYGHDYKQALADFQLVAGRAPLPPKYTFGYWWSRYWQYSDNEFVDLVQKLKSMDVPLDVLIIDMDWHETWGLRKKNPPGTNTDSASAGPATPGKKSSSPRPRIFSDGPKTSS
ncbi:MAG: TIM-barrel domain-containing protein [Alistipes senegalensis]